MRRNNCWLAVLAVSAALPILRNGLAGERLSVDYESAELQTNRSKAAYEAHGSNQPAVSIGANDETNTVSRRCHTELPSKTSRTSRFPRTVEQPDSPIKEIRVSSDETACQRSTKLADDGTLDERQRRLGEQLNLPGAESKLRDVFTKEESPGRTNKFQTVEPALEATRRSFTAIPHTTREPTAAGITGERRLSPWISRGAIKDFSGRANDVIHRASGDRKAGVTRTRRDGETNRWGSLGDGVDSGRSHYSHVGRSSRGDDPLMTSRTKARKALGLMENRPVGSRGSDAVDAAAVGGINARGDIGFSTSSEDAREQTVLKRSSRIDTAVDVSTGSGSTRRNAGRSESTTFDKKPRATGDFLGFEGRSQGAKIDKLMQSFPSRRRRPKRYIRSSPEKEESEISRGSTDRVERLANSPKSILSFTSKLSSRADDEDRERHGERSSSQPSSHKSGTAEFVEETPEPRDIAPKRRSTVNSDVEGDNGSVPSIRREIRAPFSTSSWTISIHSVPDSHEHPSSGRDEGNFFASRDTLASDTPSKGYHSAKIEEIPSVNLVDLHTASYNQGNETTVEDDSNFNEYGTAEDTQTVENATAKGGAKDDGGVSKTESSYDTNREIKDSVDGSKEGAEKDAIKAMEPLPNNATDNLLGFTDSSQNSAAVNRKPTYSSDDMNSLAGGISMAERNDSIVSKFDGTDAQDNSIVQSASEETEEKLEPARDSIVGAHLNQSSSNERPEGSRVLGFSLRRGSENVQILLPSKGESKRSEVDDPSNSLVERNDRAEKSDESESRGLNGPPTNGSVIVFKDGEPKSQKLLNQNSRPAADEIEDNEPRKFALARAQPKDVQEEGSSDNGTENGINQDERGKKNIEDHPTPTSSSVERPHSPKERKSRSSWMAGRNSTAGPMNPEPAVTSTAKWITDEGRREETTGSPKIDPQTQNDVPGGSSGFDHPTESVDRSGDRLTVTSDSGNVGKDLGTTSIGTNPTQPDHDPSIPAAGVNDDQSLGANVTVNSLGYDGQSLASVEDASPRNMDNSSHDLEPREQWPVKHSAVVEGDLVLGGLMMVHEREDRITCGPVMPQGGVQALEAMLYTLDRLNDREIVPGVKIGAHILDDCDKDTYGLEMAVDFIKGSISNIDGAEYHCNKTAVRKVISGVVGAASSVTSIQVANLLRLFRIPQVSFFSTSPELSNKQRFEYFSRTIPSDHYQVKAMVDIVQKMNWSYVSIIYEESNYGIKAFEELEELLGKNDICIAIKEKLVKDSGVAEETAYDNIVLKLLTKPRARGCIIFGSDQEVAGVMRAVRRCNATGAFSWIGSDGWSARGLVSNGNEPEVEGTLSVQPQANPVKGFEEYFLNLTVENNRRNPWFVEFWEDHFHCRYPNASMTPYNKKYMKPCTTKERLTKLDTAFEDQLQFVSDAVMAFAYAFRDMHRDLCHGKPGLCDDMKPTNGTMLLKYLQEVNFEGLSGDKFKFDKNGDGPARYNIIHFKQTEPGKYKWVRVGEYLEGVLQLNMSEIQFKLGHPQPPESVCSLPCEVGQAKKYVEGERCCWHCFNCTQYQIRDPKDETQCIPCRQGTVPDDTHSTCRDIPEEFLRPESGWAIGAMSFSATGILITMFVGGVFLKHNDTPVVRASGRELSYVLLSGILLCYLVTFALVLRPTDIVCGIQRFAAGFCFTVVYAALLTKTNRITRIFNASKHSAKRPSFISPRSQLIICSGLVFVQILINGVWIIIDPARAMHHYPTREDNLLVCNSYIDASYMIAFAYPIMLIVVCTVYAVLTRKIPEAFNESKHIGFTMYTTCVIWLAFVPLYFGTGNNVALRITSMSVTISLSASVTIACLFTPKLYIILIRPERNVRQSMMPARYSTTKSSAVTATNASSMIAPITLTAATCDQNKTVKKHIITTIDCSTQSEYFEMEVKDQKNGKPPPTVVSRSTQTSSNNDKDSNAVVTNKDSKENTATTKQLNNNARIGNGPVNQADVAL